MKTLSATQRRVLTPACPPELIRLATFTLVSGLVTVLLGQDLPVPEVLTLLAAVAGVTLAMTGLSTASSNVESIAAAARACAPVRHVLAHAAVA